MFNDALSIFLVFLCFILAVGAPFSILMVAGGERIERQQRTGCLVAGCCVPQDHAQCGGLLHRSPTDQFGV